MEGCSLQDAALLALQAGTGLACSGYFQGTSGAFDSLLLMPCCLVNLRKAMLAAMPMPDGTCCAADLDTAAALQHLQPGLRQSCLLLAMTASPTVRQRLQHCHSSPAPSRQQGAQPQLLQLACAMNTACKRLAGRLPSHKKRLGGRRRAAMFAAINWQPWRSSQQDTSALHGLDARAIFDQLDRNRDEFIDIKELGVRPSPFTSHAGLGYAPARDCHEEQHALNASISCISAAKQQYV